MISNEIKIKIYNLHKSEGKTLEEVGSRYDITRERVRQIINQVEHRMYIERTDPLGLKLPVRIFNALYTAGLTVQQAKNMNIVELTNIRNIGPKAALLIKSL